MTTRVLITATPPTPNGDLHVGHLAGPYLGGDVYCRFRRLLGDVATYVSYSDHHQTYVSASAIRQGVEPRLMADSCARQIAETLMLADINIDSFGMPSPKYVEHVKSFFLGLWDAGRIRRKSFPAHCDPGTGAALFEANVRGYCPVCFAESAGMICEACGHPNNASTLELPTTSAEPRRQVRAENVELVVLEIEPFREQLTEFYQGKAGAWRPHVLQYVDEILAGPLTDAPITYISDWGIPAPFPGCAGQVINGWPEMVPGFQYAAECVRPEGAPVKDLAPDEPFSLVQFLGFDNSYYCSIVHPCLAWAAGQDPMVPACILTNEFYEINGFKFSTSKRNLIWARDLLARRPVDQVRFYLALTNPEHQKTSYVESSFDMLVSTRLLEPWERLLGTMDQLVPASSAKDGLECSPETNRRFADIVRRFRRLYTIETFSLQRAAEHLSNLLVWGGACGESAKHSPYRTVRRETFAFLTHLILNVLPLVAQPLMPRFANRIREVAGLGPVTGWNDEACFSAIRGAPIDRLRNVLRERG